jgi:hypothetical protein
MRLRTHAEPTSRAAAESWTARAMDTTHDDGDQAGLHNDDILVLAFLRIVIADQSSQFMSRPEVFFFLFILIQINYLYSISDF